MDSSDAFFSVLFDAGEHTCFGHSAKDTKVFDVEKKSSAFQFFSINPLDGESDRCASEAYHFPQRPRRADGNVIKFRNFLIEIDDPTMSVQEQLDYIAKLKMPFSTAVYSGGKSVHFIISLAESLDDRNDYDQLAKRIFRAVPKADKCCKNPSRFSRMPEHYRSEKGRSQTLLKVESRIPLQKLEHWLSERGIGMVEQKKVLSLELQAGQLTTLRPSTRTFLMAGADDGVWNDSLFKAACDCFSNNFTFEEFAEMAENITGHLDSNDLATIRSALRRCDSNSSSSDY